MADAKAVPINPEKLLEAAREFAEHASGAGRPRPIWLRRSVSSSYYSLFHALCRDAVDQLLPAAPPQDRLGIARLFGHRQMKFVCGQIAEREGFGVHENVLPIVDQLKRTQLADVAASFCDLQEARHRADYDHRAVLEKAVAIAHIEDAKKASDTLKSANEDDRRTLHVLFAFAARPNLS